MKETSAELYQSSKYAKALCISLPKAGKTCFLYAGAMGLLPWQRHGAVVDQPSHMHVLTFDANAFGGVRSFIAQACRADPKKVEAALKGTRIYNLQDSFFAVSETRDSHNPVFYAEVLHTLETIAEKVATQKGVHCVLISSLTGLAAGLERGVMGAPATEGSKKGYADIEKWTRFSSQMAEVRNFAQIDKHHLLWEAHLHEPRSMGKNDGKTAPKESIMVSGKTGQNFAYNCEQVFKIQRMVGQKHPGSNVDSTFFNTSPSVEFFTGGRSTNELLNPKEPCMTVMLSKLGLEVGQWGRPAKKVA